MAKEKKVRTPVNWKKEAKLLQDISLSFYGLYLHLRCLAGYYAQVFPRRRRFSQDRQ